jgi:hypothetical protein
MSNRPNSEMTRDKDEEAVEGEVEGKIEVEEAEMEC